MKKIKTFLALAMTAALTVPAHALSLKIADNHRSNDSTVVALKSFSKNIKEQSGGKIRAKVFANGVLGDETQVLQGVQQGIIDIARVSTANLRNFADGYSVLSMPYLFRDMDHFYNFTRSNRANDFFKMTENQGMIGLSFYTNGFRSFYTKNTPILTPADLKGLKIRVMGDPTAISMMKSLNGTPTPMAYSEVFGAMQQGVIDGAESAPTVLTKGSHAEVAKAFSMDEHSLLADIIVVSKKTWEKLTPEERQMIQTEIAKSADYQHDLYIKDLNDAIVKSKEMGVKFYEVDKSKFKAMVQPMYDKLSPEKKQLVENIQAI